MAVLAHTHTRSAAILTTTLPAATEQLILQMRVGSSVLTLSGERRPLTSD